MPDILIRGMEMPTGCASCDFAIYHADSAYHYCFWLKQVFVKPDARLKDCPLHELPEHGDLIDRDAFDADCRKRYCSACDNYNGAKCRACWVDDMLGDVVDFEAVIPSNKEEYK